MNRERVARIGAIIMLLLIGWLIGHWTLARPGTEGGVEDAFRAWFWERRGLDLAVQVGLIFTGALGIAALLPGNAEIQNGMEE
ncbi:MAG: hypothetical protein JXA33_24325 [Anaerolineae bacterium]|nr:hypothetical protein [Anaerolineae bacterium]